MTEEQELAAEYWPDYAATLDDRETDYDESWLDRKRKGPGMIETFIASGSYVYVPEGWEYFENYSGSYIKPANALEAQQQCSVAYGGAYRRKDLKAIRIPWHRGKAWAILRRSIAPNVSGTARYYKGAARKKREQDAVKAAGGKM